MNWMQQEFKNSEEAISNSRPRASKEEPSLP